MSHLPAVELEWPKGLNVTASVIWLHGLGADGNDFAPIVPQLNLPAGVGVRFIFPMRLLSPSRSTMGMSCLPGMTSNRSMGVVT